MYCIIDREKIHKVYNFHSVRALIQKIISGTLGNALLFLLSCCQQWNGRQDKEDTPAGLKSMLFQWADMEFGVVLRRTGRKLT